MTLSEKIQAGFVRLAEAINAVNDKVGSGGTPANRGSVAIVDFGATVASSATVTVPCDWVTVDSVITLAPNTMGTHHNDSDEHLYGEFTLKATNVAGGVGFDILMESTTKFGFKGTFKINWSVIN